MRERLLDEVETLRTEIATLMQAAVKVSSEAIAETQDEVIISGERNLLSVSDFSSDMGQLRRTFELFEQKAQLMRLLDIAGQAEGVRIFIGGESQVVPFEDLSIVSSPYEVNGKVVGTLGVIGLGAIGVEVANAAHLLGMKVLGFDPAKVNLDGGALALGHPLGASGARITGKAASLLARVGGRYALATQCIGGGQGIATVLESVELERV